MKKLVSLAEKGSLADFKACLSKQSYSPSELFPAIRTALLWEQTEKAKLLFEAGADPLEENEEGDQLLTHAASGGNPELVKHMLSLGCKPNHQNIHQRTPLHHAARSGNCEAIAILIEAGADPNCRDNRNATPLFQALTNNHPQAAMLLIRAGARINDGDLPWKQTPLILAASSNSIDLVELLLERGSHIEAKDESGCTPLIHGARSGNLQVVKTLLDAGADIKAVDKDGRSVFEWVAPLSPEILELVLNRSTLSKNQASKALLKAAGDGHIQAIIRLLDQNAAIQPVHEGGESALLKAALQKSLPAFGIILRDPAANIDYRCGPLLKTPLMMGARTGDVAKTRLLLEAGADPAITDKIGKNALHYAAAFAHVEVLKLFEKQGVNLFSPGPGGRSLLHVAIDDTETWAKDEDRTATIQWLLSRNLDPDVPDESGKTPMMAAAYRGYVGIVRLFLEKGADISLKDQKGRSALCHSVYTGTEYGLNERFVRPKSKAADQAAPVIITLLEAGADPDDLEILAAASRWRWPGAVNLLKKSFLKRKKERPGKNRAALKQTRIP